MRHVLYVPRVVRLEPIQLPSEVDMMYVIKYPSGNYRKANGSVGTLDGAWRYATYEVAYWERQRLVERFGERANGEIVEVSS